MAKGATVIRRLNTKNPFSSPVSEVHYGAAFWSRCVRPVAVIGGSSKACVSDISQGPLCEQHALIALNDAACGQNWAAAAMVHLASIIIIMALTSLVMPAIEGSPLRLSIFPLEDNSVKDRGHVLGGGGELLIFLHSEWDVELCAGSGDCVLIYLLCLFMNICICKCMPFKSSLLIFVIYYIFYQVPLLCLLFLTIALSFIPLLLLYFWVGPGSCECEARALPLRKASICSLPFITFKIILTWKYQLLFYVITFLHYSQNPLWHSYSS